MVVIVTVVTVVVRVTFLIKTTNFTPRHQCDVFRAAFRDLAMFLPVGPDFLAVISIHGLFLLFHDPHKLTEAYGTISILVSFFYQLLQHK